MQAKLIRGSLGVILVLSLVAVITVVGGADVSAQTPDTFADDNGNIHESNIEFIAAAGVTKGCNPPTNTNYCPSGTVTRGQMAAFLTRALDLPATAEDFFGDDETSIFEGDINRLAASKITLGCNPPVNDNFCPDAEVTRGEMAAFLKRGFELPATAEDFFGDDETSIFEADINRLAASGITFGCNPPANTNFCPTQTVKRDQMASFLARALINFPPNPTTTTTTSSTTSSTTTSSTTTSSTTTSSTTTSSTTTTTTVPASPLIGQTSFRIYADDAGSEAAALALAGTNDGAVVADEATFGVRIGVSNTGTGGPVNIQPKLQYRYIDSTPPGPAWSTWLDVTAGTARVQTTNSAFLTDDQVTTERLDGPGSFVTGRVDDGDGSISTAVPLSSGEETEFLFSIRLTGADSTDQYQFRIVDVATSDYDQYDVYAAANLEFMFANGFDMGFDGNFVKATDPGDPDQWSGVQPTTAKEVTTIDVGTSTGGTFTLTVDSQTTGPIAFDALASAIDAELETLTTVTSVTISGTGVVPTPWVVTFDSPIQPLMVTGDGTLLTGGDATLTVVETTNGVRTAVYDDAFVAQGGFSALFTRLTGEPATYVRINDFNQAEDLYGRVYFRYTGTPSPAGTRIVDVVGGYNNGDSNSHSITVQSDGRILMKAGGVVGTGGEIDLTLGTIATVLDPDVWYRFEWHATTESATDAGDGSFEVQVFVGDSLTTFTNGVINNAPTRTEFEDADFGPRSQSVTAWIDEVVLSNTGWVGPAGP